MPRDGRQIRIASVSPPGRDEVLSAADIAGELQGLWLGQELKQLNREGMAVARCIVERLMRRLGLHGADRVSAKSGPMGRRPELAIELAALLLQDLPHRRDTRYDAASKAP